MIGCLRLFACVSLFVIATPIAAAGAAQPAPSVDLVVSAGHADIVSSVAYSADGQLLFSASRDGTVRTWRVADGVFLRSIPAHAGLIMSMSVCVNSNVIVTKGEDNAVRVWSIATGAKLHEEQWEYSLAAIGCLSTGEVVTALDALGTEIRWGKPEAATWHRETLPQGVAPRILAISTDVLYVAEDKQVTIYGLGTSLTRRSQFALRSPPEELFVDGEFLASVDKNGVMDVFHLSSVEPVLSTNIRGVGAWQLSARTHALAMLGQRTLEICDLLSKEVTRTEIAPVGYTAAAFHPTNDTIATGLYGGGIRVLDTHSGAIRKSMSPSGLAVTDVQVSASGLRVVATGPSFVGEWSLGSQERVQTFATFVSLAAEARWLEGIGKLISKTSSTVQSWDTRSERRDRDIRSPEGNPLPFACNDAGRCAWPQQQADAREIAMHDFDKGDRPLTIPLGGDDTLDLDVSPDGRWVAAAVNQNAVRLINSTTGAERRLALETRPSISPFGESPFLQSRLTQFIVPANGNATVVKFSRDGRFLAAANDQAIHVWTLSDAAAAPLLLRGGPTVRCLAWINNNRLLSADADGTLRAWSPSGGNSNSEVIARLGEMPTVLSASPDGALIAIALWDGRVEVWSARTHQLLLSVAVASGGKWIAATPDGRFDAAEDGWRAVAWRFGNSTTDVRPPEQYYQDFFYAGLVDEVLRGAYRPVERGPPEKLNRQAPQVTLRAIKTTPASWQFIPPEGFVDHSERIRFAIEAQGSPPERRIEGLGLTVNGIVAYRWPENRRVNGVAREEIELETPPGALRVTAYAFNEDRIRSTEAVWERPMERSGYQPLPTTLHVVAIAIGDYPPEIGPLNYTANDAQLVEDILRSASAEWYAANDAILKQRFEAQDLYNPQTIFRAPSNLDIRVLKDGNATRSAILAALTSLAKRAKRRDSVIIYYTGHGVSDGNRFYLVPHGAALHNSDPGEHEIAKAASTLISEDDIEQALLSLYVNHGALILDACQTGQLAVGAELKGPLRVPGLGHLAYEKGLHLLTAAESNGVAYESKGIKHGFLTYALFQNGMRERHGDMQPPDGRLELGEWLAYGSQRSGDLMRQSIPALGSDAPHARYVPRRKAQADALVLAKGRSQ